MSNDGNELEGKQTSKIMSEIFEIISIKEVEICRFVEHRIGHNYYKSKDIELDYYDFFRLQLLRSSGITIPTAYYLMRVLLGLDKRITNPVALGCIRVLPVIRRFAKKGRDWKFIREDCCNTNK